MLCQTPLVGGEEHICLKCLCELPRTGHNFLEENPATYLFGGKVPVYHAAAFLHYEKGGHVQQLIHSLKYHDNREIGFRLGRMAGLRYQKAILSDRPDLLLPVPLHPKKRKQRGYNQSEWIARGLNTLLKLPIDTTSLRRTKETETQTHKQTYDRWLNMQNIFCRRPRSPGRKTHPPYRRCHHHRIDHRSMCRSTADDPWSTGERAGDSDGVKNGYSLTKRFKS